MPTHIREDSDAVSSTLTWTLLSLKCQLFPEIFVHSGTLHTQNRALDILLAAASFSISVERDGHGDFTIPPWLTFQEAVTEQEGPVKEQPQTRSVTKDAADR